MFRLLFLPFRMTLGSVRLGFGVIRLLGVRRLILVGIGVAIGLLIAPTPGSELRAKLREAMGDAGLGADFDAAGQVTLASSNGRAADGSDGEQSPSDSVITPGGSS